MLCPPPETIKPKGAWRNNRRDRQLQASVDTLRNEIYARTALKNSNQARLALGKSIDSNVKKQYSGNYIPYPRADLKVLGQKRNL